jgi:hypothetical protein
MWFSSKGLAIIFVELVVALRENKSTGYCGGNFFLVRSAGVRREIVN